MHPNVLILSGMQGILTIRLNNPPAVEFACRAALTAARVRTRSPWQYYFVSKQSLSAGVKVVVCVAMTISFQALRQGCGDKRELKNTQKGPRIRRCGTPGHFPNYVVLPFNEAEQIDKELDGRGLIKPTRAH